MSERAGPGRRTNKLGNRAAYYGTALKELVGSMPKPAGVDAIRIG
jgi:hypothetical protein